MTIEEYIKDNIAKNPKLATLGKNLLEYVTNKDSYGLNSVPQEEFFEHFNISTFDELAKLIGDYKKTADIQIFAHQYHQYYTVGMSFGKYMGSGNYQSIKYKS